jgi:hypothetical protein
MFRQNPYSSNFAIEKMMFYNNVPLFIRTFTTMQWLSTLLQQEIEKLQY